MRGGVFSEGKNGDKFGCYRVLGVKPKGYNRNDEIKIPHPATQARAALCLLFSQSVCAPIVRARHASNTANYSRCCVARVLR